jgi:hypothetical protein
MNKLWPFFVIKHDKLSLCKLIVFNNLSLAVTNCVPHLQSNTVISAISIPKQTSFKLINPRVK